jgi:hypothetical protein
MTIYVVGSLTDEEHDLLQERGWRLIIPPPMQDLWAVVFDEGLFTTLDTRFPPPADFESQIKQLIVEGLDDDEILERLDPDTAGTDLVGLVRRLMDVKSGRLSLGQEICKFCDKPITGDKYAHDGLWICEQCWDERLRSTS